MKRFIALIGGFLAAALVAEETTSWTAPARAAARKNPVPVNATSVSLGKSIYERECVQCHGAKGNGNGRMAAKLSKKPGDLSSPNLWQQSDGALLWKLTEGHKPMPRFKNLMSDEERWPLINYVRTLAPKPAPPPQPKEEAKS